MEKQLERLKNAVYIERSNNNTIYLNQINAFSKIINTAITHPYILLVAQMQSGKTDTFLLSAFEFLRYDMVNQVIIFSGNSDLELKTQTKNSINDFGFKYSNYLQTYTEMDQIESQTMFYNLKSKIKVVWSGDIKSSSNEYSNTLFIWEESHYAQSIEMLPYNFIKSINLSRSGEIGKYIEKRNYFISVSATPFSEIANIILQNQEKKIVYLIPSNNYKGIKYFLDNNMIIPHENTPNDLMNAIQTTQNRIPLNKHIYGIIRCFGKYEKQFIEVANTCGWEVQYYNLELKNIINKDIGLHSEPLQNTLIFIKGALRMGKQVCKDHIGFVFETSENPNTDTILQALLGRMCSFTDVRHIRIYLHLNVLGSGELEKYMCLIQNLEEDKPLTILPIKGMNIKFNGNKQISYCPLFIPAILVSQTIISCIISIFNDINNEIYSSIIFKNIEQKENICSIIINNETVFSIHKLSKPTNFQKLPKIIKAYQNGADFSSGTHINNINIWLVDTIIDEYKLQVNDIFIEVKHKIKLEENTVNVKTTKKELFYE